MKKKINMGSTPLRILPSWRTRIRHLMHAKESFLLMRLRVKPAMTVNGWSITFLAMTIALFLSSCEKEIEFNGEHSDPKLVINSLVEPGHRVEAFISKSYFFLDTPDTSAPEDVVVSLYVNDNHIGEMTRFYDTVWEYYDNVSYHLVPGFYHDFRPQTGDVVKIKASANGFEDAEGETTALPVDIDFQYDIEVLNWHAEYYYPYFSEPGVPEGDSVLRVGGTLELSINITDPNPGKTNYFRLVEDQRIRTQDGENSWYVIFDYDDPVFGASMTENDFVDASDLDTRPEGVFTDMLFDGSSYRLKLKIRFVCNVDEEFDPDFFRVPFLLEHLSKEYYNYLNTCNQGDEVMGFFAEPVQTYSNVTNGFGIVAGTTVDTIWLALPIEESRLACFLQKK